MVASANARIDKRQTILGLIASAEGENRVYFTNVAVGNSITARLSEHSTHARKFMVNKLMNGIDLLTVLCMSKATIVTKKPEKGEFIDLSPEALTKTTIIDLLKGR